MQSPQKTATDISVLHTVAWGTTPRGFGKCPSCQGRPQLWVPFRGCVRVSGMCDAQPCTSIHHNADHCCKSMAIPQFFRTGTLSMLSYDQPSKLVRSTIVLYRGISRLFIRNFFSPPDLAVQHTPITRYDSFIVQLPITIVRLVSTSRTRDGYHRIHIPDDAIDNA